MGMTPFEAWYGKKPTVHHLKTFGCIMHVKNTAPHFHKLGDRGCKMISVGYECGSNAFRAYDPMTRRVHVTRDVVFDQDAQWDWTRSSEEHLGAEHGDDIFDVELITINHGELGQDPGAMATPSSAPTTPATPPVTHQHGRRHQEVHARRL